MARVFTRTRTKGGHKTYTCTGCGEAVVPGETFFTWSRRFGRTGRTYYKHTKCGRPRASELSSRKTAVIEDAIADAEQAIGEWSPSIDGIEPGETSFEIAVDDLDSIMEDVASQAEEVGQEYEESAGNMPESLQYGEQAENMRSVAQDLESWASDVRDWASSATTNVDLPSRDADETPDGEEMTEEEWREAVASAVDDAANEIQSAATDALGDLPEYG